MNVGVYGATENKLFLLQKVILFLRSIFGNIWQNRAEIERNKVEEVTKPILLEYQ